MHSSLHWTAYNMFEFCGFLKCNIGSWIFVAIFGPWRFRNTSTHIQRGSNPLFFFIHFHLSPISSLFLLEGAWHSCGLAAAFWPALAVLKGQIKAYYIFEGGLHSDSPIKQISHTQSQATTIWINSQPDSPKRLFSPDWWIYICPNNHN